MRTVDPELWYKKVRKPRIQLTRPMRFGMKPATGFEHLVRAGFMDAMREFGSNCSVRAVERSNRIGGPCEKHTYRVIKAVLLCLGLYVVLYSAYLMEEKPALLINLLSNQRSVQYIHFPAVGLCSTGIFSAKELNKYTMLLASRDNNSTYTVEDIKANLMKFGAVLNLAVPPVDVMFINFLNRVQVNFNVTEMMFRLSPKCSSMLRRCSWRGRLMPCDILFGTRLTQLGFCCLFNARYLPEDLNTPPKTNDLVGQDFGLSFVVKNSDDHFVYARRPTVGYELLVFEGSEFPLMEGGGVRLYPVQLNASLFVPVRARAEQHADTLKYYREKWLGCRTRRTGRKSWRSSFAWCLMTCRRRTVSALCGCRPYNLPAGRHHAPLCTVNDLPCLNKHREKFMYYYPGESNEPSLGEELQDAQECLHCTPDCARLAFSAAAAYKHYVLGESIFQNFVSEGISLVNASIVRVFYTSEHQQGYSVEANLQWYEVIAILASQWISVMGVTLVFLTELLFHCVFRWTHHYRRRARVVRQARINRYSLQ